MDTKERNGIDLAEVEEIRKRQQEYTEEIHEKLLTWLTMMVWSLTQRIPEKISFSFIDYTNVFDCVDHNKIWKLLKEMEIPEHCTCLWENYAGQKAIVRIKRGTTD